MSSACLSRNSRGRIGSAGDALYSRIAEGDCDPSVEKAHSRLMKSIGTVSKNLKDINQKPKKGNQKEVGRKVHSTRGDVMRTHHQKVKRPEDE